MDVSIGRASSGDVGWLALNNALAVLPSCATTIRVPSLPVGRPAQGGTTTTPAPGTPLPEDCPARMLPVAPPGATAVPGLEGCARDVALMLPLAERIPWVTIVGCLPAFGTDLSLLLSSGPDGWK